jgi:deoxyribodipyrimidine photolyase-related protein
MPRPIKRRNACDMDITLIYPHQLFDQHPAIAAGRPIFLIEDPLFFGNDLHWPASMHRQKLLLHRLSMRHYTDRLRALQHDVTIVPNPAPEATTSSILLEKNLPKNITAVHVVDPIDDVLLRRLRRWCAGRKVALQLSPSPQFLSPESFLTQTIAGKKKPFMARFYEAQRKRMNLLLTEDGGPVGGRWSFDTENRAKLPKRHIAPREPRADVSAWQDAAASIEQQFAHHPGSLADFRWPVTHEQAQSWLAQFLHERFEHFGEYEDAIAVDHVFLYHSALTPALNIGLLTPQQVVDATMAYAAKHPSIPLNSLEGFLRQIIGWREFMRGIYQYHGTSIRRRNFWNFTQRMPASCYDGTTGIPPIDRVIRLLLREGYCHHIERLMVLGNFFLLCRIHPDDVYRWFMEMFVDSYDWVMVPNVYGMSQFADGGTFTTKPYLSGSNYLKKMSNEESGPWCEIWDGLFWSFIDDHSDFFLKNPRLSMMVRTWQKMAPEKQQAHRQQAADFLTSFHQSS